MPIVFYNLNGKEYKAYEIITKITPLSKNSIEYKDKNQVLTINVTSNSSVGYIKFQ